jgi:polynucleotide 5'-hydroxyl-kinase GRC3/NOL9
MSPSAFNIPPEWRESAEEVESQGGPVMVIGAAGSGKTTFSLYLAGSFCRRGKRVAWIDADPGQSFIGPPAAFSLGLYSGAAELLKRKSPLVMGFIGNVSPVGHLLDAVTCVQKLYNKALEFGPGLVLINTCGLVNGAAARELAYHQIDMLAPRYVMAIQQKTEVEHLLSPHAHRAGLLIHRLPVSPDAKVSTAEARRAVREQRFKEYFRGADFQDIALSDVGVHGPGLGTGERLGFRDINQLSKILNSIVVHAELSADRLFVITDGNYTEEEQYTARERYGVREITVVTRAELDYLLIGLNDDRNLCQGLGIIRDLDLKELTVRVITPLKDISAIRHIALGSLRVNPAGNELRQW